MTNEHSFKVGDKVTANQYYDIDINGYSATIPIGEEGVIEDVWDDELLVSFNRFGLSLIRPISEFEPIQPLDRRTAFLTRLQSLLREFDAKIYGGQSDIYDEDVLYIQIGNDRIAYRNGQHNVCYPHINADNIIDFNNE